MRLSSHQLVMWKLPRLIGLQQERSCSTAGMEWHGIPVPSFEGFAGCHMDPSERWAQVGEDDWADGSSWLEMIGPAHPSGYCPASLYLAGWELPVLLPAKPW